MYKNLTVLEISKGLKGWQPGLNLWKVIRKCPAMEEAIYDPDNLKETEQSKILGLQQCCDHRSCEMQTQTNAGKCGYEVLAFYQFLLEHLSLKQAIPGEKHWLAKFKSLNSHEKNTVIDMAINRVLLCRADIEIASKGMVILEISEKYNKDDLIGKTFKQIINPAIQTKQQLTKTNIELGKSINISERDQDDKKVKKARIKDSDPGKDLPADSPLAKMMAAIAKAGSYVPGEKAPTIDPNKN